MNEQIYLLAIWRLKGNAFGVKIREKITEMTGNTIMFGSLYNSLDYLAQKGYVSSRREKSPNDRGGNNRVYYVITSRGLDALQKARELQKSIWRGTTRYAFDPGKK